MRYLFPWLCGCTGQVGADGRLSGPVEVVVVVVEEEEVVIPFLLSLRASRSE